MREAAQIPAETEVSKQELDRAYDLVRRVRSRSLNRSETDSDLGSALKDSLENPHYSNYADANTPQEGLELLDWASTALTKQSSHGGDFSRKLREEFQRNQASDLDISEVEYRRVQLEKVFLVGIYDSDRRKAQHSLAELAALAQTAGAELVGAALQRRSAPDAATFVGRGKARELAEQVATLGADTVIVNAQLQPSQRRGLEDQVKVKVIDRTAVILDIFAQHASSREGKAQVELAQLQYLLPRLRGWGQSMSRQAGGRVSGGAGIGARGPGETKLETDRRRITKRIAKLRREIKQMKKSRDTKREGRLNSSLASVVIVGYTNAGKSSLLNVLVDADVMVQDALFATLDPTVRQTETPDGRAYTLSDTVGFIDELPHELVEAFRSTLEEVEYADLIVHVVDASHHNPVQQVETVHEVLADLPQVSQIPEIIVLNKADLVDALHLRALQSAIGGGIPLSTRTGQGIAQLREAIANALPSPAKPIDYVIPYDQSALVARLHEEGIVDKVEYLENGTHIVGRAGPALAQAILEAAN